MAQETPYTKEEIDARLDESERDIEEGRYYTTQEVFFLMFGQRAKIRTI